MKRNGGNIMGMILLGIYWYLVLCITGATPTNFLVIRDFAVSADVSLVPFADLLAISQANGGAGRLIQIGGNILLFVPLGFLLPLCWEGWRNMKRVIGFGFAMSLFIECNQLFNYRATSIDDLILNTAGAAAGFLCYLVLIRLLRMPVKVQERAQKLPVIALFMVWGIRIAIELPMYLEWIGG